MTELPELLYALYQQKKIFIIDDMCGRTALSLNKDQVQCACSYTVKGKDSFEKPVWLEEHNDGKEYKPSYNIAPTDVTPVLLSSSKFKYSVNSARVLKPMMWGMIPPWHKGDYKKHSLSTNNCRIENINSSKLYSPVLKNDGRCIIVVEGFYEWQTTNKTAKVKQPYYIFSQQQEGLEMESPETWHKKYTDETGWYGIKLMFIAGLYNIWKNDETMIYSYSVITMNSNSSFDWLHHRMPAILDTEEQIEAWLDIEQVKPDMALSYLKPVKILRWHPVSTDVNNSRNKSENCNRKITLETKNKGQQTLNSWFKRAEKRKSTDDGAVSKKLKTNE